MLRRADGEGRDQLQRKRRGVVIIDQDDHIRLFRLLPVAGELEAVKQGLPVGILILVRIHGPADGGNMRGGQSGSDAGHGYLSSFCSLT